MPYSALTVGNEILRVASEQEPPISLTPLKLLKLAYIAHGWSLALLDEPLVNEKPEAWQYGPVIPSLYRAVRKYRAAPITDSVEEPVAAPQLGNDQKELIKAIINSYGALSGTQLSNMTHMPNTPWSITWHEHGQNAVIPDQLIAQHYRVLQQSRTTAN